MLSEKKKRVFFFKRQRKTFTGTEFLTHSTIRLRLRPIDVNWKQYDKHTLYAISRGGNSI